MPAMTTCVRCGGDGHFPSNRMTCDICIKAIREGTETNGADRTGTVVPVTEAYNHKNINAISNTDVELFNARPLLNEYQRLATRSAIYPGQGTPLGLAYVALKLNGEAGEMAEHVGKAMRDDDLMPMVAEGEAAALDGQLTPERRQAIIKELGDVLWYVSAAANELGATLATVAQINLAKLRDRTERNALQGSGDER